MNLPLKKTLIIIYCTILSYNSYADLLGSPYELAISNFNARKYSQSFSQTQILELEKFKWTRNLQSVFWIQLNITKSHCDNILFNKIKSDYLRKYSKVLLKILNQTDNFNEPEYIYLLNQNPIGASYFQKYNNAQNEKEKLFYRSLVETELIINQQQLRTTVWSWHELIKNIQLGKSIPKINNKSENTEFKWPFNGELWPDEIDKIETIFKYNCEDQEEIPEFPNLKLDTSIRKNSDISFELTFTELNKKMEAIYRANEESEKTDLLWIQKIADFWIYLSAQKPLTSEDENQDLLNKWEARLRQSVISIHKKYLSKKATADDSILAYRIYLSSIKQSRFELAMKKHLLKLYVDQQQYALAANTYRDIYIYNQDKAILKEIINLYNKEIATKKNGLLYEQAQYFLKRRHPTDFKK